MVPVKLSLYFLLCSASLWISCETKPQLKERDKVFHAGPIPENSGVGTTYFALYKGGKYQFCQGDFINPNCYTGDFVLSGDTITLISLKKHATIPSNRFLIRRYVDTDSSYWQWKYPNHNADWRSEYKSDTLIGASGDILPIEQNGEVVFDQRNYFIIRWDELKQSQ
ncbi:hypothetical protein KK062_10905 [Fulvivirgaceae bacterium PWU5]|uniref:Lipoprotein n=1 Tax=Dawidia cretensis TaxID=2782350 RepID=A0AAP2DZ50_9BACT|nr:hypothetical protein [Dawidia cretensis]MBT1708737.1 hypothetical protein [Dawidia cretensis]